ncbi:L-threonylcarbamoyladenylate synthase [Petroclostridium sp. X23]|uniref:L-threonylcarbamoyladenylate synthase n=1 Tax=Petroclostridium sp. X23 TaxID=3045146 RepID=UPI0032BF7700
MRVLKTEILRINPVQPEMDKIEYAAKVLRDNGTVAFPTETVYGLGANALNEQAVHKIFHAKGRPADNPLIIHISDLIELDKLVAGTTETVQKLASAFWPGPLTIIMKKSDIIPKIITAGLDTVAVRFPSHSVARSLIKASGLPIAAPSANSSGKPSPTIAQHVIDDLLGKVDMIIDGGPTEVGLESTVIDTTDEIPVLLRPGGITIEQLRNVLGEVHVDTAVTREIDKSTIPRSPGMKYTHYAPNAQVIIIEGNRQKVIETINQMTEEKRSQGMKVGVMSVDETASLYHAHHVLSVGSEGNPQSIAANLFHTLRKFDELGVDIIYAQSVNEQGIGMAIRNRLNKAAGYNIVRV